MGEDWLGDATGAKAEDGVEKGHCTENGGDHNESGCGRLHAVTKANSVPGSKMRGRLPHSGFCGCTTLHFLRTSGNSLLGARARILPHRVNRTARSMRASAACIPGVCPKTFLQAATLAGSLLTHDNSVPTRPQPPASAHSLAVDSSRGRARLMGRVMRRRPPGPTLFRLALPSRSSILCQ